MEPAYLILVGWFGGIALAWVMPVAIRNWHIARQNRLIEDCRARYILAVQALADGDEQIARASLTDIRNIELRWRLRNSGPSRLVLGFLAIGVVSLMATALRAAPLWLNAVAHSRPFDPTIIFWTVVLCIFHTLYSFYGPFVSPWIVDDCGDRLEALLNTGRGVATQRAGRKRRLRDGLAAREVFGLEPGFTMKQLSAARRRLAGRYHPDRWQSEPASAAHAAEEAMKRVNAAFDELKAKAA